MCGIDFLTFGSVSVFLKKNSDSILNKFSSIRFKKRGSVQILFIFIHLLFEWRIARSFYRKTV